MGNIFGDSSNLPPGCSVNDIPGNRPEDVEWETMLENFFDRKRIRNRRFGIPISKQEMRAMSAIYRAKKYDKIESAVDSYIQMAIEYGIDIGWQQAKTDQQETNYYVLETMDKAKQDIENFLKGNYETP